MVFRNLAASGTPGITSGPATTLTDWAQVKPLLGFTVYLPPTLPNGSCLVSASGTVHDPILGGNFVIGYILPDHSSLTLSQAPQRSTECEPFNVVSASNSGTKTMQLLKARYKSVQVLMERRVSFFLHVEIQMLCNSFLMRYSPM